MIRNLALLASLCFSLEVLASNFSGTLKSTTDHYPTRLGEPTSDLVPYLNLELKDKYKIRSNFRAQWSVMALTNTASKAPPENFYGDVSEAFLEFRESSFKLKLGMNTLNWGVVDVSSPSDVVNTMAIFHPLRTFKQGAPMVDVIVGGDDLSLEAIYIPVQRPPQLPSKDSRWLPRRILISSSYGNVVIPEHLEYEYIAPRTLDRALNNNYGARLASHLGKLDLQLTHFEGAATSPSLNPDITFNTLTTICPVGYCAKTPIFLSPVYYRVRASGFGFVWALDNLIVRGESAYQATVSSTVAQNFEPWRWSNVLALETNIDMGHSTLTVLAQGYYAKNSKAADNFMSSSYRLFDRTVVLGARWAYSEEYTFLLSTLYETESRGLFAMLGFDNKLSDHLRWGLSWRNFSGDRDGLIKTFEKNSHGSMELSYFF